MSKELKPIIKQMEKVCKRTKHLNKGCKNCCYGCPLRISQSRFCLKKIFINDNVDCLELVGKEWY